MAFFSSKKEETASSPMEEAKRKIQEQTSKELAVADVTELVNHLTKDCFELCFANPGPITTAAETKCTEQCAKKYMQAWDLISQTYVSRLQKP